MKSVSRGGRNRQCIQAEGGRLGAAVGGWPVRAGNEGGHGRESGKLPHADYSIELLSIQVHCPDLKTLFL